ncbi:hypothetical protein LINGRAHAP2_LOCUS13019 [Linum grandiflorum]
MDAAASRRYLSPISQSRFSGITIGENDELNEDDILWTDDFNPTNILTSAAAAGAKQKPKRKVGNHRRSVSFQHTASSGILAALPELNHYRTNKPMVSKTIPAPVPRPAAAERDGFSDFLSTQSAPGRKLKQSAPMKVPMMKQRRNNSRFKEDGGRFDDEMMLPPHEIVERENWRRSSASHSMLEGVGRTLKGRDLRQVRNAVFRQTGFLD